MKIILTFLFIVLFTQANPDSFTIDEIRAEGNTKTKLSVILAESFIDIGKAITQEEIQESVKRIQSLNTFSEVKSSLEKKKNGHYILIFHVKERWTSVIPFVGFASGAGARS